MSYITQIDREGDLNIALASFSATCASNSGALFLTPANLLEIAAMATGFDSALTANANAKAAAKLAQQNKDAQVKASRSTLGKWAKTFRANLAISDALLEQLMLPHHSTPGTKTPPTQPLDLVATPDVQGLVTLKWKRNGNRSGTQFMVETQHAPGGAWSLAGGTTKVRFDFNAVLNEYVAFRVVAVRDGESSQPSLPVVLWSNGQGGELSLAA